MAAVVLRIEADPGHQILRTLPRVDPSVLWIANGAPMIWPTVERGFRDEYVVLEHDLHLAAQRTHAAAVELADVLAFEADRAGGLIDELCDQTCRWTCRNRDSSPTSPSVSPLLIVKLTSSTAWT